MSLREYVRDLCDPDAPLGSTIRYHHNDPGCSAGKDACLNVTRVEDGWVYYCQRCGEGGHIGLYGMTPRQTLAWAKSSAKLKSDTGSTRKVVLPKDFTREIPPAGLAWLYQYGINNFEIFRFEIGYSPSMGRVILPVFDKAGSLVYWQGRYIGDYKKDGAKKYINQWRASRDLIYFENAIRDKDASIVLVEDILSAIKVGRVTNCIALLFATIPRRLVARLTATGYETIWIWLDSDKAGYTAQQLMRLRSLNYPVRRVYSPHDPKCYNEDEIRDYLRREYGA